MSAIGPDLPPHLLAKRKRKQEEQTEGAASTPSGAKKPPSPSNGEKKRRTIGPVMPPAPLDERPLEPVKPTEEQSESEDDEFGPALPSNVTDKDADTADDEESTFSKPPPEPSEGKARRDDWMTMPPKQDDLAARFDPNIRRPTKFNTGKGTKGPPDINGDSSAWHETPEQKRKRLEDEMMGISKPASAGPIASTNSSHDGKDAAAAKTAREQIEKTRGPSLIDKHKSRNDTEAEDDPSKRAFDREKDMGSGGRISSSQKREMLNKAASFSSKFSGGSYL